MQFPLSFFRLAALATLSCLIASAAQAQSSGTEDIRESVALLPLEGQRLDPTLVKICSELLADHLGTYSDRKLITSSDIQAMLSLEEQKMALACEDQASCIAEIGGALGVDELLRASLSRLGSKLIVSMTRIHVQSASVLKRATIKIENDEDLYDEALKDAVLELYEKKAAPKRPQSMAERRERVVETMTTPVADGGPDLLEWTVMSMGAGAITGGLVFGFLANAQAKKSEQVGGQLAVEDAKGLALIANILYGLGGTGMATGLALWYFGDDGPKDLAVAPMLTSGGAYISIRGVFP